MRANFCDQYRGSVPSGDSGRGVGPRPPGRQCRRSPLNPAIRFAIGRRQATMTDRDEQSVIRSLQSAHNESALPVDA
jgi:hypothetical protein